ncbi:MAG: hypothetical protein ABIA93_06200 [Candidatus Woesearchaeota archaeon]
MFDVRYLGLRIVPSLAATREMIHNGYSLQDVKMVLEEGIDAPRRRKIGTIERWLQRNRKVINVVVVRDYHEILREEVWVLIHCGRFSR